MGRPRKQPENPFSPDDLVEPTQSFATVIRDQEYVFNSKSKPVRADHPAVQQTPHLFKLADGGR